MDDGRAKTAPERALERALKAAAASRRAPEPPTALRDIAWRASMPGSAARARGRAAADLACAAALAACLACSVAVGPPEAGLAARLDDPAIAAAVRDAVSPAVWERLGLRLGIGSE